MWEKTVQWMVTKKGAWITILVMTILGVGIAGGLRSFSVPNSVGSVPSQAESAVVQELGEQFPHADEAQLLVVYTSAEDDQILSSTTLQELRNTAGELAGFGSADSTSEPFGPITSEDQKAAILSVPVQTAEVAADGTQTAIPNAELATVIEQVRAEAAATAPDQTKVWVTGGPAFGADIAAAFDGANFTLLAVTVGIVALLLLLTYRSPVLWLIPLPVVGLADGAAGAMTAMTGELSGLGFDTGIISVLVFGAGTNYALLLISRYREELRKTSDHRTALRDAVLATTGAIVASNLTVVIALATMLLGIVPSTRGLGLAAAVGLVFALVFVLTLLPAVLSLVGRKVFWPFIPKPGQERSEKQSRWFTVANSVVRFRLPVLLTAIAALTVMVLPLLSTSIGLSKTEQFRVPSESAAGFEVLQEHFPAGEAEPLTVVTTAGAAEQLRSDLESVDGVERVGQAETAVDSDLVRFSVVGEAEPDTDEANELLERVRTVAHGTELDSIAVETNVLTSGDVTALVGGASAESYDLLQASARDLVIIAPLVLLVVFIVLVLLLRAVLGPVVLLLLNSLSSLAAIGAGTWIGTTVFGFPALDVNVPLLAFIFLVALGIDYTIFLAHRTMLESRTAPIREAVVQAVGHTGVVITSAGVVLAAVFAALGVLPLVTLGQLGLIVGLGVLIDTLVVRSMVVPAALALLGEKTWWPRKPRNPELPDPAETVHEQRPVRQLEKV
ncbi:MMPL family transporter [Micrococcoides hystricis]|uniref:MMPL family transporter n=1 Tax=Micrococcoides hystricis TaxID=1572761 RepID=A0ABV6P7W7_9MICC